MESNRGNATYYIRVYYSVPRLGFSDLIVDLILSITHRRRVYLPRKLHELATQYNVSHFTNAKVLHCWSLEKKFLRSKRERNNDSPKCFVESYPRSKPGAGKRW